jgi:hypothetical protein
MIKKDIHAVGQDKRSWKNKASGGNAEQETCGLCWELEQRDPGPFVKKKEIVERIPSEYLEQIHLQCLPHTHLWSARPSACGFVVMIIVGSSVVMPNRPLVMFGMGFGG